MGARKAHMSSYGGKLQQIRFLQSHRPRPNTAGCSFRTDPPECVGMEVDCDGLPAGLPKCEKARRALIGKSVDVAAFGTRDHVALIKWLTCESGARE